MTQAELTSSSALASEPPRGRTSVSSRALSSVASAVAAAALGVNARSVGVVLADERGQLELTVTAPIRVVALDRVTRDAAVIARAGGSILDRTTAAQAEIRTRVTALTGHRVARVIVRLSSADIRQERRVR